MELDITGAVSMEVIVEANTILHGNGAPLNEPWVGSSDFLSPEHFHHLLFYWNNGHEWDVAPGHVKDDAAHRFLSIGTRDHFRWKVARDVATARENGVVPRRFSIVNTGTFGLNWFSFGFCRLLHRKEGGGPWHPTRNYGGPETCTQFPAPLEFHRQCPFELPCISTRGRTARHHGPGGYAPRGKCALPGSSCSGCRNCGH